jgi:ankyrin repeat protein
MFGSKNKHRTKFNIDWSNVKPRHLNNFDINQKDEYGLLPLYFACQWSEIWVVQKLIDMGADINDKDSQFLGLRWRAGGGYDGYTGVDSGNEFLKVLFQNNAKISPDLIGAVLNYEMFKLIINSVNKSQISPEKGKKYIHELLDSQKPSYGTLSSNKYIRMPDSKNLILIMKDLVKLGAELDSETLYIATSIQRQQPDEVIEVLLDWISDIDFEDINTSHQILKPFNFAAMYCGVTIMKKFLLAGAEINPDERFENPLFSAVDSSNEDAVKFLLESGANPNCREVQEHSPIYGKSALHRAIDATVMSDENTHNIVRILVEHGADLNGLRRENGKLVTPLDQAIKHQNFHSQFNRTERDINRQNMSRMTVELLKSSGAKKTVYKTSRTLE